MIYLEYIERDRHVPIEVFRYMGDQTSSWVDANADRMILQLGRTLRLGPQPSYLAFWKIAGLHRLDDWEHYFGGKEWYDNSRSQAMHRSIHIQRAGLYREVREAAQATHGLHIVEFFDAESRHDEAIAKSFDQRAAPFPGCPPTHVAAPCRRLRPRPRSPRGMDVSLLRNDGNLSPRPKRCRWG